MQCLKDEFVYLSSPGSLVETENCIEFDVIALSVTCVERWYGKLCFGEDVLSKKAHTLIAKPVLLDHKWEVEKIVGVVVNAEYQDGKIIARLRIPKKFEHLIELLKLEPSPIQSVSVGFVILDQEEKDGVILVKDLEFKELSLVIEGADKNAKRLSGDCEDINERVSKESLGKSNWWEDPELRKKAPRDYFLDPASRRYPYKTWDGKISCERLKAAMQLSALHGHRQIYDRAKALYEKHCKKGG